MESPQENKPYTDIKLTGWQVNFLPEKLRPYGVLARLDRPIGWWLLLLPGWWSIVLASGGVGGMNAYSWYLMGAFLLGAIVMRGAGCVINDFWDRDIDKMVERTRGRPLASGAVSPKQGLVFLGVLLSGGALILFSMNIFTIVLGFLVLPLIVLYPLMKRITYWPQAFLGITFNFGALMGWSAVTGGLSLAPILLYIGGIFWTIGYDTIYAHQDKEDDALAGIKSTALRFDAQSKIWVSAFYMIALVFFAAAIFLHTLDAINLALLILPALHMGWQVMRWNMDDQDNSLQIFKSNKVFGLIFLAVCLV